MRTASDGRGDEQWEDPFSPSPSPADDEATRVFSRNGLPPASAHGTPSETDSTTMPLTRPGSETADEGPSAADGVPETGNSAFTRKFVRARPGRRSGAAGVPDNQDGLGGLGERPPSVEERPPPRGPGSPGDEGPFPDEGPGSRGPGRRRPPSRKRRKRRFRLRWIITLVLLTVLAMPPATWGWVWYTARQDDRMASDAIVVLGASQYHGTPSPVFEARLRHAQELYEEGVAPSIVTVGGKQPDDAYTEAESGRNWLVDVGVPPDQVVAVEEGADTLESIAAVAEAFDDRGWETAIMVTDPWHSLRTERMAVDHGIEAGTSPARSGPAVIERETQLWYITRETASLWYYWIFNDSSDIRVNAA